MRLGMFALMMPVTTSARGRLRGDDQMDAGGARHLGDPGDGPFDIGGSGLHQIGQFIDDHDNVRHSIWND